MNLYADADKAEDPEVKAKLMEKKADLEEKIDEVNQQLSK
jgi:hypothetical protein